MSDVEALAENGSSDRFDQSRKEDAALVGDQVRACLTDHYDVDDNRVVSVESVKDGAYETNGDYDVIDFLDYAGVDWLVDERPAIVPVGERIRPNEEGRRDFSWRLDNGTSQPCESERIPAGLLMRGLAPRELFFGWRDGDTLDRAWLLDVRRVVEAIACGVVRIDQRNTGDGTVAGYIHIGDLASAGAVINTWQEEL